MFGNWRPVPLPDAVVTELASAATQAFVRNETAPALGCSAAAKPEPVGMLQPTKACSQVQMPMHTASHTNC